MKPAAEQLLQADIERRREIAAALGYTLREDVCTLAGIKPSTEEDWRKRGRPVARYVRLGNNVLYETAHLSERLREMSTEPRAMAPKDLL